jgi:hypothetical protein
MNAHRSGARKREAPAVNSPERQLGEEWQTDEARRAGTAVECRAFGAHFKCNPIPAWRPGLFIGGPPGLIHCAQLFMTPFILRRWI